nr:hypothetical protein [Tanacetum cinerariifolium]
LVNDQDDADKDMFDVNVLGGEEVFAAAGQNENVVNITTEELTLAQALEALKNFKNQEKPVKPKKKDQTRLDKEAAKKLQAEFDEEARLLVKGKEKRAGEELIQESTKKQKVKDDKEKAELKQVMETIPDEEEIAIDAIPLAVKVESADEESLGEDASKQGRIEAIDADEDVTLVNDQDDADKDMFDVNVLGGEEVFAAAGQNENVVNITTEELTLAQALEALKNFKNKEKPVKPKKKDQTRLDKEAAKKLQAEFDEEARLARKQAEKEQEANIALTET